MVAIIEDEKRCDDIIDSIMERVDEDHIQKVFRQWLWRNVFEESIPDDKGIKYPQKMIEKLDSDPIYAKEMVKRWLGFNYGSDRDLVTRLGFRRNDLLSIGDNAISWHEKITISGYQDTIARRGYLLEDEREKAVSLYGILREREETIRKETGRGVFS
jgi:hypothetical protein